MNILVSDVDRTSLLATVSPSAMMDEVERELRALGLSSGYAHHPADPTMNLAEALSSRRCIEPYLQLTYLRDWVAGLGLRLSDGSMAESWLAPRSAAGPDLKAALMGREDVAQTLESVTVKVMAYPPVRRWRSATLATAEAAMSLAKANVQGLRPAACLRMIAVEEGYRLLALFAGSTIAAELADLTWRKALDAMPEGSVLSQDKPPSDEVESQPVFTTEDTADCRRILFAVLWNDAASMMQETADRLGKEHVALCGAFPESALLALRITPQADQAGLADLLKQALSDQRASLLEAPSFDGPLQGIQTANEDALALRWREVNLP